MFLFFAYQADAPLASCGLRRPTSGRSSATGAMACRNEGPGAWFGFRLQGSRGWVWVSGFRGLEFGLDLKA